VLLLYLAKHKNTELASFHSNAVLVLCQTSTSDRLISSILLTCDLYSRCYMTPKACSQWVSAVGRWGP